MNTYIVIMIRLSLDFLTMSIIYCYQYQHVLKSFYNRLH